MKNMYSTKSEFEKHQFSKNELDLLAKKFNVFGDTDILQTMHLFSAEYLMTFNIKLNKNLC